MPTTGSTGLNNLLQNTAVTQTTLPSWYDAAQQNIVNQAGTAQAAAPTGMGDTTAQQAVNTLQGPANPFTQAQGTLNTIATGAANPWLTDPNTGAVTPNTQTAMGGLFSAQQNQLNQLLPTLTAGTQAKAIGSGNFGGLQGQTAVDTAKANALANLQAQQMTAAINNQQTGATAANALGNVGSQGISSALNTGTYQMNQPFQSATNYANLINSVNAPTTASQQTQASPLTQLGTISSALGGGLSAINSTATGASLLKALGVDKLLPGSSTALPNGVPTGATLDSSGSGNYVLNGQTYSPSGTLLDTSGSVSSGGLNATMPTFDSSGNVTNSMDPNTYGAG
jgi:hypothetical protein